MGEQSGVSIDKLTKAYVKIREKRAEISSKFKEEDENLVSQLDKIKKHCLITVKNMVSRVYVPTQGWFTSQLGHVIGQAIGSLCISLYFSMRFLSSLTNDLTRLT